MMPHITKGYRDLLLTCRGFLEKAGYPPKQTWTWLERTGKVMGLACYGGWRVRQGSLGLSCYSPKEGVSGCLVTLPRCRADGEEEVGLESYQQLDIKKGPDFLLQYPK